MRWQVFIDCHRIDYRNEKDEDGERRERTVKDIQAYILLSEKFSIKYK